MTTIPQTARPPFRDRVEVVLSGELPECARGWAVDEVEEAVTQEALAFVGARVDLRRPPRPAQPCRADIVVNLEGHLIHARAEAPTPRIALHLAAERVHRQASSLAVQAGRPRQLP